MNENERAVLEGIIERIRDIAEDVRTLDDGYYFYSELCDVADDLNSFVVANLNGDDCND